MFRINLWNNSVPRVELDQRARDARLRLDQIERLAVPPAAEMSGLFSRWSMSTAEAAAALLKGADCT
jgi:hypothetical protein